MPYALIPDGFTLKKVTKAQEQAVNAKRRHDNVQAFIENENTPLLVGAGALAFSIPFLVEMFLQAQEEMLNVTLTNKQKDTLLTHPSLGPVGVANLIARKVGRSVLDVDLSDLEKRLRGFKFGGLA